jgi:ADP-ribose pyrophosphatase
LGLITRKDAISSKQIFEGVIFNVRLDEVRRPNGSTMVLELVEHNGGVVIACKPKPDEVMLIKQYRYAIDEELIELPAGRLEIGEDRFECAKRELIEETGYRAETWEELPPIYSAPGFCNELLTCYLASDISWVGKNLDEDEWTDVVTVSLKDAWQMVLDRKIRDAKTVAVLAMICHSPRP